LKTGLRLDEEINPQTPRQKDAYLSKQTLLVHKWQQRAQSMTT
jgi:hypothetical protein